MGGRKYGFLHGDNQTRLCHLCLDTLGSIVDIFDNETPFDAQDIGNALNSFEIAEHVNIDIDGVD